ncbi:hypothetical protein O9X98_06295 [Agrobacterium salinitolerans]|nr:hypothetical protein [Agrobacterium salinitolerans]
MPFVHSVFTFRKPADTAELNDVLQRLEVLPGLAAAGEPAGRDYLDQFKVGDEVSVSLISPTGKAARVHSGLIMGIVEAAGETVETNSAVIVEPAQKPELGSTANSMMSRVQMWGRVNRIGPQRAFSPEAELKPGREISRSVSVTAARLERLSSHATTEATIFDGDTVVTADDAIAPAPSGPRF